MVGLIAAAVFWMGVKEPTKEEKLGVTGQEGKTDLGVA
jgi:hypothetical protein